MGKSRLKISQSVYEKVATLLVEALERGTLDWPLPSPPIVDSDFPVREPISAQELIEQGLALLNIDKGMFDAKLNNVVDLIVPHRMNLTDDPYEVHQKWLEKRTDLVAEKLIFLINTDWLARALDPQAPDADRWWLSVALLNGLSTEPTGQPIHQGYHLVESIALGERPGTWHTQPEAGPQNIDWNPHAIVPRMTSVIAHESGVKAAIWILERLLQSDVNRRKLLIEWVRLLMERPSLIEPLGLVQILLKLSQDDSEEVAMSTSLCLAKLIDFDRDSGMQVCQELMARDEVMVRRAMADVLTRLFRRLTFDAIPYFNKLRQDEDENVLAAVSSTSGDLRFLDTDLWANTLVELSNHKLSVVRRNIVPSLRDYFETFPEDERQLLPTLWQDGDEVVRTRMRELLSRMEEVSPKQFSNRITDLVSNGCDLQPLWELLDARKADASNGWKRWLAGEGDLPEVEQKPHHISDMEAPDELPELDDALETLDQELGFLD